MVTQIYTIQNAEEAEACIAAGTDHLGVMPRQPIEGALSSGWIEDGEVQKIIDLARGRSKVVLLSVCDDVAYNCEIVRRFKPDVLHVSGERYVADADFCRRVRELSPGTKVMQAVAVGGPEAIGRAKKCAECADMLLLDSVNAALGGTIGAAGVTHDWSIDRAIVEAVGIPVIIAGGLGPDNVEAAIKAVRPYGVDSMTRTDVFTASGEHLSDRKDIDRVRLFCERAHRAGAEV